MVRVVKDEAIDEYAPLLKSNEEVTVNYYRFTTDALYTTFKHCINKEHDGVKIPKETLLEEWTMMYKLIKDMKDDIMNTGRNPYHDFFIDGKGYAIALVASHHCERFRNELNELLDNTRNEALDSDKAILFPNLDKCITYMLTDTECEDLYKVLNITNIIHSYILGIKNNEKAGMAELLAGIIYDLKHDGVQIKLEDNSNKKENVYLMVRKNENVVTLDNDYLLKGDNMKNVKRKQNVPTDINIEKVEQLVDFVETSKNDGEVKDRNIQYFCESFDKTFEEEIKLSKQEIEKYSLIIKSNIDKVSNVIYK